MTIRKSSALAAALLVYLVALAAYAAARSPRADRVDADDARLVRWGETVYAANCAACHGARLEGQPDWRRAGPDGRLPAPPHDETGHTWHHPNDDLIHVVQHGLVAGVDRPPGYQGNMPAFAGVLSREETVAVLSFIESRWSYDFRAWQARVNDAAAKH